MLPSLRQSSTPQHNLISMMAEVLILALRATEIDAFGNVNVSNFGVVLLVLAVSLIFHKMQRDWSLETLQPEDLEPKLKAENYTSNKKVVFTNLSKEGQVSFSAEQALMKEQDVIYVTERAVFRLIDSGLKHRNCSGIDVQKQILDLMDFTKIEETLEFKLPEIQ